MEKIKNKKFIPNEIIIANMANEQIENFYENGNDKKWEELVKSINFQPETETKKNNTFEALFKIYYALGGFSLNKTERDEAYKFVIEMAKELTSEDFHREFDAMNTDKYGQEEKHITENGSTSNPQFAKFIKKYFLSEEYRKAFSDIKRCRLYTIDILYNNWQDRVCGKNYAVDAELEMEKLTPSVLFKLLDPTIYANVQKGNEKLAEVVGEYHYPQYLFNYMQNVFNKAKKNKEQFIISCEKDTINSVSYEILEKDNPLGFVLGDITNCRKRYGDEEERCVRVGYEMPNAGFLVFKDSEKIFAYTLVWYDESTKTLCLDNIEIPKITINNIALNCSRIKQDDFVMAIQQASENIAKSMNENGYEVIQVTLGDGGYDNSQNIFSFGNSKLSTFSLNPSNLWGYYDCSGVCNLNYILYKKETEKIDKKTAKNIAKSVETLKEIKTKLRRDVIQGNETYQI